MLTSYQLTKLTIMATLKPYIADAPINQEWNDETRWRFIREMYLHFAARICQISTNRRNPLLRSIKPFFLNLAGGKIEYPLCRGRAFLATIASVEDELFSWECQKLFHEIRVFMTRSDLSFNSEENRRWVDCAHHHLAELLVGYEELNLFPYLANIPQPNKETDLLSRELRKGFSLN